MSLVTLAVAAILFSVGTYLILQRMLSRVIIGLGLISHGANLLIMLAGSGPANPAVITGEAVAPIADPLPQAELPQDLHHGASPGLAGRK